MAREAAEIAVFYAAAPRLASEGDPQRRQSFVNHPRASVAGNNRKTAMTTSRRIVDLLGMALALALSLAGILPAAARPELCESAARRAAQDAGVPVDVMQAIALTETGRRANGRLRPWPWTANTEGEGHWFDPRAEAEDFPRRTLARGQTSIDLGCFQINWRWHGAEFDRPEALFDPAVAAGYAARMLRDLYRELGSWDAAAGAYHSRTPHLAARYRARFAQIRAGLPDQGADPPAPPPTATASLRVNAYPLLTGAAASGASLFPAALPPARPLFESRP